jgi:hypothetical protein
MVFLQHNLHLLSWQSSAHLRRSEFGPASCPAVGAAFGLDPPEFPPILGAWNEGRSTHTGL